MTTTSKHWRQIAVHKTYRKHLIKHYHIINGFATTRNNNDSIDLHTRSIHKNQRRKNWPVCLTVACQKLVHHVFYTNKPAWNGSVDQRRVWPTASVNVLTFVCRYVPVHQCHTTYKGKGSRVAPVTRDHTVLPATNTFIHNWNKPHLPLLPSRS